MFPVLLPQSCGLYQHAGQVQQFLCCSELACNVASYTLLAGALKQSVCTATPKLQLFGAAALCFKL